jgi:hypothetical protein
MRDLMKIMKPFLVAALALVSLPIAGCHRSKTYEATIEVLRLTSIRKDEHGTPISTDLEFSYVDCPGSQTEVIRGGKEFSACISQFKAGDRLKVKLEHKWDPEGSYDYDVYEVQGCTRVPDPNDDASFKEVRECSDWTVNGARVGFQCNYAKKKELVKACPWFRRH